MSTPSTPEKMERQEREYADSDLENSLPADAALDANGMLFPLNQSARLLTLEGHQVVQPMLECLETS